MVGSQECLVSFFSLVILDLIVEMMESFVRGMMLLAFSFMLSNLLHFFLIVSMNVADGIG